LLIYNVIGEQNIPLKILQKNQFVKISVAFTPLVQTKPYFIFHIAHSD